MLFIFSLWHTDSSEAIICFHCWQNETAGTCRQSILTGWEHNRNVKASVGNKSQTLMEIVDCRVLPREKQIDVEARRWKAVGWWQDAVSKACSSYKRLPWVSLWLCAEVQQAASCVLLLGWMFSDPMAVMPWGWDTAALAGGQHAVKPIGTSSKGLIAPACHKKVRNRDFEIYFFWWSLAACCTTVSLQWQPSVREGMLELLLESLGDAVSRSGRRFVA